MEIPVRAKPTNTISWEQRLLALSGTKYPPREHRLLSSRLMLYWVRGLA